MSSICLVRPFAFSSGGSDVIPAAVDWANITISQTDGSPEINASQTISGIDTTINLKASWTSSETVSYKKAKLSFYKNGGQVAARAATPVTASANNNDTIYFSMLAYVDASTGTYDTGTVTVTNTSRDATITMTIASPAVVSWTSHGFAANDAISFATTGALPTGVTAGTVYYVIAAGLGANAFEFSTTVGGAAVNTSGSQSGTHTGSSVMDTFTYAVQFIPGGS
jgi:hypothetical protein